MKSTDAAGFTASGSLQIYHGFSHYQIRPVLNDAIAHSIPGPLTVNVELLVPGEAVQTLPRGKVQTVDVGEVII